MYLFVNLTLCTDWLPGYGAMSSNMTQRGDYKLFRWGRLVILKVDEFRVVTV